MHRLARATRVLAVLCVLTLVPLFAAATPATAGLSTPVPMNQFEEITYDFVDSDAIFVAVLSDTRGGAVCVVDASHTDPGGLSCKGSRVAWSSPNTIVGIGTVIQPIESPMLPPGSYRLLAEDSEGNGTGLSEVLTVRACTTCDPRPAIEAVAAWKAAAAEALKGYELTCAAFAVKDVYKKVRATRGKIKKATDRADAYEAGEAGFTATVGPYVGEVVGRTLGLSFTFPSVEVITAGQDKALQILSDLSCAAGAMYADIVADPPRYDYDTVSPPSYRPIDDMGSPAGNALAQALDRQTGDGAASLTAFERFLGADERGDEDAVIAQLAAAAGFSFDTADGIADTAAQLRRHAAELSSVETYDEPVVTEESLQQVRAVHLEVASVGFTPEEVAELTAAGLTPSQVEDLLTYFDPTRLDGLQPGQTLPDLLAQQAAATQDLADQLRQFGKELVTASARAAEQQSALNTPPTASLTRTPASGAAPLAVQVDGSGSTDADGTIASWAWDFGDGGTGTGATTSHQYETPGTYAMTLTVTDDDGATDTATAQVQVVTGPTGTPPVPSFVVPTDGVEGGLVELDGSASTDPDGVVVGYTWSFGDGRPAAVASAQTSTGYVDDGTYDVTLTVTDDSGLTASLTQPVVIANLPPSLSGLSVPARVPPGASAFLITSVQDPGIQDVHAVTWDLGDGTTRTGMTLSHTWTTPGTYTVTITVTDDDGGSSVETRQVVVAPPVADAGPDVVVDEGEVVTLGGPGTTPEEGFTSYRWQTGDGGTTYGRAPQHAWRDDGVYTAVLDVIAVGQSFDEPVDSDEVKITVRNVAPTATVLVPRAARPGEPVSLRGFAADPGDDEHTFSWDLGDGTTADGDRLQHSFPAGTHVVSLTVTDDDGGSSTAQATVVAAEGVPGDGTLDNRGTDFWLPFMLGLNEQQEVPQILIGAEQAATGVVSVPGLGFSQPFTVAAGGVARVQLPQGLTDDNPVQAVLPYGVHVASSSTVAVYGLAYEQYGTDGFLGLPREVLGTRYRALAHNGAYFGGMAVLATEHGTTVRLRAPDGSVEVERTLDAGDVWRLNTRDAELGAVLPDPWDYTGVEVLSDKPVAVTSGSTCGNVPVSQTACNHLVEMLPTTAQWGRTFIVPPFATRLKGDRYRVVADVDGTEVRVGGVLVATLDAGQVHEQVVEGPAALTASHPVLVGHFAHSSSWDGVTSDPSFSLAVPVEQFQTSYVFATPDQLFDSHHVDLVVPTGQVGGVVLDGAPVPLTSFTAVPGTSWSYAALTVPPGTHAVSGAGPVGLTQYGWASYDAYSWPGGMQLADVARVLTVRLSPPTTSANVGDETCLTAEVLDRDDRPVGDVRVDWSVAGTRTVTTSTTSDAAGEAELCLTGTAAGQDDVLAAAAGFSDTARVTWTGPTAAAAPVVTATPGRSTTQHSDAVTPVAVTVVDPDTAVGDLMVTAAWSAPSALAAGAALTVQRTAQGWLVTGTAALPAGEHVLRVSASDGTSVGTADVRVTVTPEDATLTVPATRTSVVGAPVELGADVAEAQDGSLGTLGAESVVLSLARNGQASRSCVAVVVLTAPGVGTARCAVADVAVGTWSSSAQLADGERFAAVPTTGALVIAAADQGGASAPPAVPPPADGLQAQARGILQACPGDRVPRDSRGDTRGNTHERAIDCTVWYEIAKGFDSQRYGPFVPVTREQMASFVARQVEVSGGSFPQQPANAFTDDDGSVHATSIDKLASAKIVSGTGASRFDPRGLITRDQMAAFLVKAYEYRAGRTITARGDYFGDDAGNTHEVSINKSAEVGFTGGREGGYQPREVVARDAMASFLARSLDLLVEQGVFVPKS